MQKNYRWSGGPVVGVYRVLALQFDTRSPTRLLQTCALPQVAEASRLKGESVLFSSYGANRRVAGGHARRHLAGPT